MVSEEQQSEMELASEKIPVPPVENPVEELGEVEEPKPEVHRKKPRKRHRELHASILKQMEFYFGDANLSKDRFLAKLIAEDSWVDLNIFIKFNKIRTLTTDVSRIAKALKESTMLSVSEDGTKVCRTTPIQQKENSDECTVYVQRLPPEADHEWISKMFSQYGSIDYISIPKYKNKAIKGFAFVEYKKPEDAEICIKAFRAKGCVLPSQTSPNALLSITTHENCDKEVVKEPILKKEIKEENMETEIDDEFDLKRDKSELSQNGKKKKKRVSIDETVATNDEVENSKKAKKRRHGSGTESDRSDSVSSAPKVEKEQKKGKKRKGKNLESLNASDGNDEVNDSSASECDKKRKKMKRKSSDPESKNLLVQEAETQSEEETYSISKKQRMTDMSQENNCTAEATNEESKSSKDVNTDETKEESGAETMENDQICEEGKTEKEKKKKRKRKRSRRKEIIDAPDTGLEIMAKKEWKRLRNKYLEMQRTKMKQLKQHLKRAAWNQWQNAEKIKAEKEDVVEKVAVKENKSTRFTFIPGVIVRIEMESPCSDPKNFKMEIKGSSSNSAVQYVDVSEGSNFAFVRCDSIESAKSLAQKTNEERTMIILEGEEEKAYWDKMAKDRQEKIGNNVRVKQRGRDKLLKKAEKELGKHIKFDEV